MFRRVLAKIRSPVLLYIRDKALRAGLETQEEYDTRARWVDGVRAAGIIVLDPDIAGEFPTPEAVNDGLRELLKLRRK